MQLPQYLHRLKVVARHQSPLTAKTVHGQIIKLGLHQHGSLPNTLIDRYGKCGLVQHAYHVFEEMQGRDHVSWASILTAYNQSSLPHRTISIFPAMLAVDKLQPDQFVFASLVKACGSLGDTRLSKQVHARFVLSPFSEDDVVKSSLVDMYSKCGSLNCARVVFDLIKSKNSVSWTAILSAYARSGRKEDAVQIFKHAPVRNLFLWTALISGLVQSGNGIHAIYSFIEMRREGVDIADPLVLSSIIGACAKFAVLELGKQIHGLVTALGYESSLFISNALVDMYAKCSDLVAAKDIFGRMRRKDVVSWTSIIVGTAQHGQAEETLALYDEMISAGVNPNEATFVGLIYACSHVGLVSKGRKLFKSMTEDYGIGPSLQHYTCLLDLLSRSGHLVEAENVIKAMPMEPDEPTWAALLSACEHYHNTQMGIRVANHLLSLKPEDPSSYILLSNVYASAGMWQLVSQVRKLMSVMEVKKEPGYSSIDCGKDSQVFYAGEMSHPLNTEIVGLLTELNAEMKRRGYVPDTSSAVHNMEQREKERQLFLHSERLAVAYGC